eukprot:SAG22_NODE_5302_length_1041_cov_5.042463_3_plen_89_part_00
MKPAGDAGNASSVILDQLYALMPKNTPTRSFFSFLQYISISQYSITGIDPDKRPECNSHYSSNPGVVRGEGEAENLQTSARFVVTNVR